MKISSKPISILISVPCPPFGSVSGGLVDFLLNVIHWPGFCVQIDRPEDKWPAVRNLQFKRYLELSDAEYILCVDSDIVPPQNVLEMAKNKVDFCSAVCFSWQFEEPFAVVMSKDPKGEDGYIQNVPRGSPGLYERDATGLACTVISRRVVEEFRGTFRDQFDKEGMLRRDADFDFCERLKNTGYKVYVDTRFICGHMKRIDLKRVNNLVVDVKNA